MVIIGKPTEAASRTVPVNPSSEMPEKANISNPDKKLSVSVRKPGVIIFDVI